MIFRSRIPVEYCLIVFQFYFTDSPTIKLENVGVAMKKKQFLPNCQFLILVLK
jgi:hypothetical protein